MRGHDHYITLVATHLRLNADLFCRCWLLPIDLNDSTTNPFLFWVNDYLCVMCHSNLQVKILYMEDVDIYIYIYTIGCTMEVQ